MASLSNTSLEAMGILNPLMSYRFRVSFLDEEGVKLPFSNNIAMQVVKVSSFTHGFGQIVVTVEDDVTNVAAKGIQQLFELPSGNFQLVIDYLDGCESVVKTATLGFCRLDLVEHSGLDYAGSPRRYERLRINVPTREGSLIDALNEHPLATALVTMLNGSSVAVEGDPCESTARTVLSITYDHVKLTFPEIS